MCKPILIELLDMEYPKPDSKRKVRYGIFKCPVCEESFKTLVASVKNGNTTK